MNHVEPVNETGRSINWIIIWKGKFQFQGGFKSKTPAIARVFKIHQKSKNLHLTFNFYSSTSYDNN